MTNEKLTPEILRAHKGFSFTGVSTLFFCHDGNNKLFLSKRSKNTRDEQGRWEPGGGGLKHGQSAEENMLRELKEEYGVAPQQHEFIGYFDVFRTRPDGEQTHWVALCFAVKIDPSEVRIMEPENIDDSGWFDLGALPQPLHSQMTKFLSIHGNKLRQIMQS